MSDIRPPLSIECEDCNGKGQKLTSSPTHCGLTQCEVCNGKGYITNSPLSVCIPLSQLESDALLTFAVSPLESNEYIGLSKIKEGVELTFKVSEKSKLADAEHMFKLAAAIDHLAGFNANRKAITVAECQFMFGGMIRAISSRIQYHLQAMRMVR